MMEYTNEDKQNMRETLDVVLDDLRALYDAAETETLEISFYLHGDLYGRYNLCINKKKICFCNDHDKDRNILDQPLSLVKRPKIKNHDLMYAFLSEYELIRTKVEEEATYKTTEIYEMRKKLSEIKKRYSHESIIEVELEETNNPRSVEVKKENGNTIGEFRFGHDTIRIITKGNIVFVNKDEPSKVR